MFATNAHRSEVHRFKLSIVVPVFNEAPTIRDVLEEIRVQTADADTEVIVVDDGSTDGTGELVETFPIPHEVVVHHDANLGKGAAVRSGIERASGTHLLVFDADREYDPADIPRLVTPILSGKAEVVYGARVRGSGTTFPFFVNAIANKLLTAMANALFGSAISDLHTCLKLLPVPMLRQMQLHEKGFGLDTEISAELLRRGFRPYEVPVTYVGRSVEEGKKIRLMDACRCVAILLKIRLRGRTGYGHRDRSLAPAVSPPHLPDDRMVSLRHAPRSDVFRASEIARLKPSEPAPGQEITEGGPKLGIRRNAARRRSI